MGNIKSKYRFKRVGSFQTQGQWCFYCGVALKIPTAKDNKHYGNKATIDHLLPKVRGGHCTPDNTVECCYACNVDKHHLTLAEYRLVLAFRAGQLDEWQDYKFWGEGGLHESRLCSSPNNLVANGLQLSPPVSTTTIAIPTSDGFIVERRHSLRFSSIVDLTNKVMGDGK